MKKKNIIIIVLVLILGPFILGFVYEIVTAAADRSKYPPPGRVVRVNNHRVHVYEKGFGNYTIVFIPGFNTTACPYTDFSPLYNKLIDRNKIVIYDKPGYGWSEITNMPRDIETMTQELRSTLLETSQKPPYILVAHSFGSLEALRYAQRFKDEVAGIVLIDGGNPEFYANNEIKKGFINDFYYGIFSLFKTCGMIRMGFQTSEEYYSTMVSRGRNSVKYLSKDEINLDKVMYINNISNKNVQDEHLNTSSNGKIVLSNGKIGNIPLIILTSSGNNKRIKNWEKTQKDLTNWSTDSKQITVSDSDHYIHQYKPEIVLKEINDLIDKVSSKK